MTLLLVFAVTLLVAVLISGLAERSVLSTAVLFLAAGFLAGQGYFGAIPALHGDLLQRLSEIALFSILFTDGMRTGGACEIARSWRLPGRALMFGMPLTIIGIALLAHYILNVSWVPAFLVAAVLSPTDPVFVSAIFRFEGISANVKHLLNIESGLNDGLALPIVLILLAHLSGGGTSVQEIAVELALGVAVGVAVPWIAIHLEKSRLFEAVGLYQPLNAFAIGLLVLGICYSTSSNLFLGAYSAGISVATFSSSLAESFREFGELIAELLKLMALLVFGSVTAPSFFTSLSGWEYAFIVLAVFAIRPPAVVLSLARSSLDWRERLLAGWFGPKGFASVVYGLLVLQAGLDRLSHVIGVAVTASILVYSSTDILIGRWLQPRERQAAAEDSEQLREQQNESPRPEGK